MMARVGEDRRYSISRSIRSCHFGSMIGISNHLNMIDKRIGLPIIFLLKDPIPAFNPLILGIVIKVIHFEGKSTPIFSVLCIEFVVQQIWVIYFTYFDAKLQFSIVKWGEMIVIVIGTVFPIFHKRIAKWLDLQSSTKWSGTVSEIIF